MNALPTPPTAVQLLPTRVEWKWQVGLVLSMVLGAFCMVETARAEALAVEVLAMESLEIGAGVLVMPESGGGFIPGPTLVLDAQSLVIAPTGTLDIKNNAMVVRTGSFATIEGYVITGYNGGTWDGFGIRSSTAASDPDHLGAVGVIDNADAQLAEFYGLTLGSNVEILVAYTYYGDANLDHDVNAADLALMGLGTGWYYGDFNYSGAVDAADFALYQASFDVLHPVPEPGVAGLVAAGALACLRRRRE